MPKFFSVRKAGPGIGAGMYCSDDGLCAAPGYCTRYREHPTPHRDTALNWGNISYILGVPQNQCYFGFGNIEQLQAWLFDEEWRLHLHKRGFVIKVWSLPDDSKFPKMRVGNAQAVAVKSALLEHSPEYLSLVDLKPMKLASDNKPLSPGYGGQ